MQNSFKCTEPGCFKEYNLEKNLTRHVTTAHSAKPPSLECPEPGCSKSYKLQHHLTRHIILSHSNGEPSTGEVFPCPHPECPFTFSCEMYLKKHVQCIHSGAKAYKCTKCETSFPKKFQLRQHEFLVHNEVLPFECKVCGKPHNRLSHLVRHEKKHEGFTCPEEGCGQVFTKWTLLRKHKATEHKKAYVCEVCNKSFLRPVHLKEHSATHAASNPFECPVEGCGRSYTAKRNLKAHIKSAHMDVTFACTVEGCTAKLATKQKLKEHIEKIHTMKSPKPVKKRKEKSAIGTNICGFHYHKNPPLGVMEIVTSESENETMDCKSKRRKAMKLGDPESDAIVLSESDRTRRDSASSDNGASTTGKKSKKLSTATATKSQQSLSGGNPANLYPSIVIKEEFISPQTDTKKRPKKSGVSVCDRKRKNSASVTKSNVSLNISDRKRTESVSSTGESPSPRVKAEDIFKRMYTTQPSSDLTSESECESQLSKDIKQIISRHQAVRGSGSD